MLRLLGVPAWHKPASENGDHPPLPASLPACLLIYLACHGRWMERDGLATVFWPERSTEEARRNLRVNLHRMRQLLVDMGCEPALQSERNRVCLQLPSDLDALRKAISAADGAALAGFDLTQWLAGFRVPGFEAFFQWADAWGVQLSSDWRTAATQAARASLGQATAPLWLDALQSRLRAVTPQTLLR